MLTDSHGFSGFAVKDFEVTKQFYGETLGLNVEETPMGLKLHLAGGNTVYVYQKPDQQPATYTMLNFPVSNIDDAVSQLHEKGIQMEHYPGMTDEHGIARGLSSGKGPDIVWFTDPDGNIISVLQDH